MRNWLKKIVFCGVLIGGPMAAWAAATEPLTAEKVGFRHCALMYHNDAIKEDAAHFKPFLVKYVDEQPTNQAGFDAFLFMYHTLPNGRRTEYDATVMTDWQKILTAYFDQNTDVPALNEAVKELRSKDLLPAAAKHPVYTMFAVPWLHGNAKDFGDVDGDGVSENLSIPLDRQKVIVWYINQVAECMKSSPELALWGFYMMREDMQGENLEVAKEICFYAHKLGYKVMWIPYYTAGGRENWKQAGFDAAFLQSNWQFTGPQTRRNQLLNAIDEAKRLGMALELELYDSSPRPRHRQIFYETLESAYLTNFNAPCAYYFGGDSLYKNQNKEDRALYETWMDFVAGKPVTAPREGSWAMQKLPDGSTEINYSFVQESSPGAIDIYLQEPGEKIFTGSVSLEYLDSAANEYKPLGWLNRRKKETNRGQYQNITLEIPELKTTGLRIKLTPDISGRSANIVDVNCQMTPSVSNEIYSLSYKQPYYSDLPSAKPQYPDKNGRDLLNGVLRTENWNDYVGWQTLGKVQLFLDLSYVTEFDEIWLYSYENIEHGGVFLPQTLTATITDSKPIFANNGMGVVPDGGKIRSYSNYKVSPDRRVLLFKLPKNTAGRYVTLEMTTKGWLFLGEVELYKRGKRVSPAQIQLTYRPHPTGLGNEVEYGDDGFMLTDGVITANYGKDAVGFRENLTRHIVIDTGLPNADINSVDCYLIDGGQGNVLAPEKITVAVSDDVTKWPEAVTVTPAADNSGINRTLKQTISLPDSKGRYVKLEITPRNGSWAFISEIAVNGLDSKPEAL